MVVRVIGAIRAILSFVKEYPDAHFRGNRRRRTTAGRAWHGRCSLVCRRSRMSYWDDFGVVPNSLDTTDV